MQTPFLNKIQILIDQNQLEEALLLLQERKIWIPIAVEKKIVDLSNQVRELQQKNVRGNISPPEVDEREKEIKRSLLRLIEPYKKSGDKNSSIPRGYLWLVIGILTGIILIILLTCIN